MSNTPVSMEGKLKIVVGSVYLILAAVFASKTKIPVLVFLTAVLFVLHEPAWTIAKRMHTSWLPVAIASLFQAMLAFIVRIVFGATSAGPWLFKLLVFFSCSFAILAIEEGVRELHWHSRNSRVPHP